MVGQSSSVKSCTLCLIRPSPSLIAMVDPSDCGPPLQLSAEPEEGVLGGHELAPNVVEPLELAFHEPAVRGDRLIHPVGRLGDLQMDLAAEALAEAGTQGLHPGLEVALRLAALAGNEVKAADREGGGEQDPGHVRGD